MSLACRGDDHAGCDSSSCDCGCHTRVRPVACVGCGARERLRAHPDGLLCPPCLEARK